MLIAEVPGWGRTRCAVEREVRRRGWRLATSPADADALVVCGRPGPQLNAAFDLVWSQLPGPRARGVALVSRAVPAVLDQVQAELADEPQQRLDARSRGTDPAMGTPAPGGGVDTDGGKSDAGAGSAEGETQDGEHGADPAGAGEASGDRAEDGSHAAVSAGQQSESGANDTGPGHDNAGHEDAGQGSAMHGMDHGDMDMPMPGGIPLAEGGEDRDGLNLDVLHVPLGPVLPGWPAGLVLRCSLQGDVVTDAQVDVLGPAEPAPVGEALIHGSPADLLDRAATLLTIAGWQDAATSAARLCDELLGTDTPESCVPALDRLIGRIRRSRLLRWSLRSRAGTAGDPAAEPEPGAVLGADPYDRLLGLLGDARAALDGGTTPLRATPLDRLPALLIGQQMAEVRLLVAGLDLDPAALLRVGATRS